MSEINRLSDAILRSTFDLGDIEQEMALRERDCKEQLETLSLHKKRDVLVFGETLSIQREREKMLMEDVDLLEVEYRLFGVRKTIARRLRRTLGECATLTKLNMSEWGEQFAQLLPETDPQKRDVLTEHQLQFVAAVSVPHIDTILHRRSRSYDLLKEAIKSYADAEEMVTDAVVQHVLNRLLAISAGDQASDPSPARRSGA